MRHRVEGKKLNRDAPHRKALLKNMSESLILTGKITTTLPKAQYLRPFIEKLISRSKAGGNYQTLRYLRTKLGSEGAIRKLVTEIGPQNKDRNGGYTRIIKTGNRVGDNAKTARIEFVEETK